MKHGRHDHKPQGETHSTESGNTTVKKGQGKGEQALYLQDRNKHN